MDGVLTASCALPLVFPFRAHPSHPLPSHPLTAGGPQGEEEMGEEGLMPTIMVDGEPQKVRYQPTLRYIGRPSLHTTTYNSSYTRMLHLVWGTGMFG